MTEAQANAVYDILVREAGASEACRGRSDFVYHMTHGKCEEYRFQGTLGFGGKFWPSWMRVSCYSEDETPERLATILRTDAKLKDLAATWDK